MTSSYDSSTTKPIYKGVKIVWYVLGLVEAILALRFIFKLLAANASAGFVSFMYSISQGLVSPFNSIFSKTFVGNFVFEWTTLVAMIAYWLIAWAIVKLLLLTRTVSTPEAAQRLDQEDDK